MGIVAPPTKSKSHSKQKSVNISSASILKERPMSAALLTQFMTKKLGADKFYRILKSGKDEDPYAMLAGDVSLSEAKVKEYGKIMKNLKSHYLILKID